MTGDQIVAGFQLMADLYLTIAERDQEILRLENEITRLRAENDQKEHSL